MNKDENRRGSLITCGGLIIYSIMLFLLPFL